MRILLIIFVQISSFLLVGISDTRAQGIKIDWEVKHRFRFFHAKPKDAPSIFFKMQEAAWKEVSSQSDFEEEYAISLMERKLNDQKWLQKFYRNHQKELSITNNEMERGGHARWGWAKHIVKNNKSCWDAKQQWHSSCSTDSIGSPLRTDYVKPQRHTVLARVTGLPKVKKHTCIWSAKITSAFLGKAKNVKSITKPCDDTVALRIPFDTNKSGISKATKITVTVKKRRNLKATANISVRDILIVGIGDSFSSGEGNPDVPVIMHRNPSHKKDGIVHNSSGLRPQVFNQDRTKLIKTNKSDKFKIIEKTNKDGTIPREKGIVPHRQNINRPANWLDRNCHRSMYSYHSRTAIQVALETNKRTAVTFLGYACSGAKLTDGILLNFDGQEKVNSNKLSPKGKKRRPLPQLARLIEELCAIEVSHRRRDRVKVADITTGIKGTTTKPVYMPKCGNGNAADYLRPIDILITSIGGNDVGFLPIIVNTVLSENTTNDSASKKRRIRRTKKSLLVKIANAAIGHDTETAEKDRLPQLAGRFTSFTKALNASGIKVKSHRVTDNKIKKNIYLTAFPSLEFNRNKQICGYIKNGDKAPRVREAKLERIAGMTMLPPNRWLALNGEKMKKASIFSEKLIVEMKAAANKQSMVFIEEHRKDFEHHGICAQAANADTDKYERMLAPFFRKSGIRDNKWYNGFSAYKYDCYRSRQRYFRTFDDAFYCANTIHGNYPSKNGRNEGNIALMSLGGPFHPTAEGHSYIADAMINSLRNLDVVESNLK